MIEGKALFTGYLFTFDRWDEYWKAALKRDNGNIGKLTTKTQSWFVNYGVTDCLTVIAAMRYVRTHASQGTLRSMQGLAGLLRGREISDPDGARGQFRSAARAYSYVSVAQFQALKLRGTYKYLYNRPAPSQVDQGIRALLPTNGVPSVRRRCCLGRRRLPTSPRGSRWGRPSPPSSTRARAPMGCARRVASPAIGRRWPRPPPLAVKFRGAAWERRPRPPMLPRAFALLNMAMHDAAVACWDTKFTYFNPRPSQLDPELKTAVGFSRGFLDGADPGPR